MKVEVSMGLRVEEKKGKKMYNKEGGSGDKTWPRLRRNEYINAWSPL